jgi:hypothetical protein
MKTFLNVMLCGWVLGTAAAMIDSKHDLTVPGIALILTIGSLLFMVNYPRRPQRRTRRSSFLAL